MALSNHRAEKVACETASEFSSRLLRQITGGLACLGIAMGVETGLFDVLVSLGGEPKTSQEIADAANLKERYVREWLGCMAASDIVTFDPAQGRYWLPAHRASIVQSGLLSMAIPCLAGGFFEVAECFKKNGPAGVEYDKYPKLDEVLTKLHQPFIRDQFLQEFIPSMPKVHQQLVRGIRVLEVGCREGECLRMMAARFPKTSVCGLDICPRVIGKARAKTKEAGLTNAEFVCQDVCGMPADWARKFDYLFVYFVLHDLPYPESGLREMYRVLKPGGALSVVDTATRTRLQDNIAEEEDRGYVLTQFTMSLMSCLPVSCRPGDGAGLGAMWGREKARQMLEDASFEVLSITATNAELNGLHYLCRKPTCENSHSICSLNGMT